MWFSFLSKILFKPTIILLFILLLFLGDYKLQFIFWLLKYLPGLHQGEAFYGRVVELQHGKCQGQWKMSRSNRLWNVKVKQNVNCQGQTECELSRSNRMWNVKVKQNGKCQGQTEWEMSRSNRMGNVKVKQNGKCQGQTEVANIIWSYDLIWPSTFVIYNSTWSIQYPMD